MNQEYLAKLGTKAKDNNMISSDWYDIYSVKRGLRNQNGTGVLVGLTGIGDVHGYVINEGEKIPVKGSLRYRGIKVKEMAKTFMSEDRFGYEECIYLLLFGELPNSEDLIKFNKLLGKNRQLPENFVEDMILKAPSKDIMNKLARNILALYSYDENPDDTSIENILAQSISIISKMPALLAYAYQSKAYNFFDQSLVIHSVDENLSTSENILKLSRADGKYTKSEAKILDLALVLHAEHGGGNNSAFTSHVVASSGTDIYSSLAAAIGSLKGPRHGGANIKVDLMMKEMKNEIKNYEDEDEIKAYLLKILDKKAFDKSGLIYGVGHAVYTKSDPRAEILKKAARALAIEKGSEKEFEFYERIERLAPIAFTEYKNIDKKICANVDFYSGLVYNMLRIPEDLFTPLFACARTAGWCAHILEEVQTGGKIIRPAYKNIKPKTKYNKIEERK